MAEPTEQTARNMTCRTWMATRCTTVNAARRSPVCSGRPASKPRFLNPDLNTDGVSFDVEEIDEDRHDICTTLSNDVDSIYVSPRIWLGVQGCAWGANLRYWHLQASEGAYDPSIGGLGTWDDYDCGVPDFGFTQLQPSGSLHDRPRAHPPVLPARLLRCRPPWASVTPRSNTTNRCAALANADEGLLTRFRPGQSPVAGHGPAVRPVWPQADIPLLLRALVLQCPLVGLVGPDADVGRNVRLGATSTDPNISPAAPRSVNGAYTNVDDTLFIGEIQLGLEWDYCPAVPAGQRLLPRRARVSAVGRRQGLFAADSFAGAEIVDQVDPVSIHHARMPSAAEPQMDLIGFAIGTGLTW